MAKPGQFHAKCNYIYYRTIIILLVRDSISDTVHCFMSVERNSRVMSERYLSLTSYQIF